MKETFLNIYYVVSWAGCNIWLEDRIFDKWDEALEYYNQHLTELSLRIEEVTTVRKIKIVWPQNTRRVG